MGRRAWAVTAENENYVRRYLARNNRHVDFLAGSLRTPEQLNALVHDDLSANEIWSMRSSIRMEISRAKKEIANNRDVQITLSRRAHAALKELADDDDSTLSETIEKYIESILEMPRVQREKF